jgi:hypothetical protein
MGHKQPLKPILAQWLVSGGYRPLDTPKCLADLYATI